MILTSMTPAAQKVEIAPQLVPALDDWMLTGLALLVAVSGVVILRWRKSTGADRQPPH
jgi:hypothetical protein